VRRSLGFAVLLVAAAVAAAVGIAVIRGPDGPTYDLLRQRTEQDIPGALGYALSPPPEGFRPALAPGQARARYPAEGGEVSVALASIRDTFEDTTYGPAWVLFARGVCLRNAKGELVSDARGNDPNNLACTDATIWVLAVDTRSGEPLVALTAFDDTETWGPEVGP
jgi:hypothetical protein